MITLCEIELSVDLWEVCAAAIIAVWGIIKVYLIKKNKKLSKIIEAVEIATTELYTEARKAKMTDPKNKLPVAKIKEFKASAIARASEILETYGIDLFSELTEEYVPVMIDKVVQSLKKGTPVIPGK
jgi:hypothetical protein